MRIAVVRSLSLRTFALAFVASAGVAAAQTTLPDKKEIDPAALKAAQSAKPTKPFANAAPSYQSKQPDKKPAKPEPTLAEILAQVSARHPDVLVAEARVREAEALLQQAKLSAAQKTAVSYHQRKMAEAKLADAEKLRATRNLSIEEFLVVKAALDIAEAESPYAFLDSLGTEQIKLQGGASDEQRPLPALRAAVDPSKFPRGPAVETVKRELSRPLTFDFAETPLADVVPHIHRAGVTILLDTERGVEPDQPISLALTDAPLGSVLLAIEDLYRPLRFVVRDYGLLLTTEDAMGEDTVTLRDFLKHAEQSKAEPKIQF